MKRSIVLVWSVATITLGITVAHLVFAVLNLDAPPDPGLGAPRIVTDFLIVLPVIAFAGVGTLILLRRPGNVTGWVVQAIGASIGTTAFGTGYGVRGLLVAPDSLPGPDVAIWLSTWLYFPSVFLGVIVLLLTFPDGKLLSRRWRYALWMSIATAVILAVAAALLPGPLVASFADTEFYSAKNPVGPESLGTFVDVLGSIGYPLLLASILLGAAALVVRFRRSRGSQRKQLKWISAAAVLVALTWLAVVFTHEATTIGAKQISVGLFLAAITTMPVAAGFAILRYRLYDIDVIINRSLVYGSVTAILAGVFAAVNIVAQKAFVAVTGQRSDTATAVTALVVVALFTPLKGRIQSVVDRRLKETPDPAKRMLGSAEQVRHVVNVFESEQLMNRYLDEAITAFQVENGVLYLDKKRDAGAGVCARRYELS